MRLNTEWPLKKIYNEYSCYDINFCFLNIQWELAKYQQVKILCKYDRKEMEKIEDITFWCSFREWQIEAYCDIQFWNSDKLQQN